MDASLAMLLGRGLGWDGGDDRFGFLAAASTPVADADAGPAEGATPPPDYNGNGATAVLVAPPGYQSDQIMSNLKWSSGISYCDPDSLTDYGSYGSPGNLVGLVQMTAQQMVAVHFALNAEIQTQPLGAGGFAIEGFTNLSVSYAGTDVGTGTIRVANSIAPTTFTAFLPNGSSTGGDAFFNTVDTPIAGNNDWHEILRAIGITVGLTPDGNSPNGTLLGFANTLEATVMASKSYINGPAGAFNYGPTSAPQTFMQLDILALQVMYGVDYTSNNGATTYKWTPGSGDTYINGQLAIDAAGSEIFLTIWDGGGNDTFDLGLFTSNITANLKSAGTIDLGTQRADLDYVNGPGTHYASGNIFNAFAWTNNNASLIENVILGSGADRGFGNALDNTLTGNGGADALYGDPGHDILYGGDQDDYLTGGGGGGGMGDTMYGGNGNDTLQDTSNDFADYFSGGQGTDSIYAGDKGDTIYGGTETDLAYAGGGEDNVNGGAGDDSLFGGAGNDTMHGDSNNDSMYGGLDSDTMYGDGGQDYLFGDLGNDTLYGGDEHDVINSFNQNDGIYGGAGLDWFAFQVNFGVDAINDWQDSGANQDVIMITHAIFANFAALQSHMSQYDGNTVLINAGGGYGIYVVGATVASLGADDFYIY